MEEYYRIKKATGETLDLYYLKGNGITIRTEKEGVKILLRDGFYDFDCAYDKKQDAIHIIGQNGEGSIVHMICNRGGWKKKELLTGKRKMPYPKYFRLIEEDGKPLALYVIRHDGDSLLVSQIPGEEEVPTVIGYISERMPRFWAGLHRGVPSVIFFDREGKRREKKRRQKQWVIANPPPIDREEELVFVSEDESTEYYFSRIQKAGEATVRYYEMKNGVLTGKTIEKNAKDARSIAVFTENRELCLVLIGSTLGRFYRFSGNEWREDRERSELLSKQKSLCKGILLGEERKECVGVMEAKGMHLMFPLCDRERETCRFHPQENEDWTIIKGKITEMERRIARLEQSIRKEKRGDH